MLTPKQVAEAKSTQNPILIQGPMPIEAEKFAKRLKNVKEEKSGTFVFYKGTVDNYPVIVRKQVKEWKIQQPLQQWLLKNISL